MHICRLCLNLMLVLFLSNAQAQSNFIKATIVNNNNDSIQGFIDYKKWETNPKSIAFKKKLQEDKTTILPTEIKAFMVADDLYEAHTIKLEEGLETTLNEDGTYPTLKTPNDTLIFMRCHVKGVWNLYSHTLSNGKPSFYINKENDTLRLLTYKKVVADNSGGLRFTMREGYKRQLLKYFYDYQELSKKIMNSTYTVSSIQHIIADYDAYFANKKPIAYMAKPQKSNFQIHVFVGANNSFLTIKTAPNILSIPRIPNQTITGRGFDFGVSAQLFSARRINKLSFVADLDVKTMRLFKNFTNDLAISKTTFNNTYLRLYTQGRYEVLRTQRFNISANAGTVLSFTLKNDNDYTTTYVKNAPNSGIMFPKEDFKSYNVGFAAGLMCQFKPFALELRGEVNEGMSPYNSVSSRLSSLNAFLYYRLK